jgi:hypothetical protein
MLLGWKTVICSHAAVKLLVFAISRHDPFRLYAMSHGIEGNDCSLAQALGGSGLAVFWRNRPVDEADGMQKSL